MLSLPRSFRIQSAGASLLLTSAMTLAGCSGALAPTSSVSSASVTGNWQFSSASPSAAKLPSLSGELTGTTSAVTGILHSNSANACILPGTAFAVTGKADANALLTLTAVNVAGGTLALSGTLSADGKSLTNASYKVTGGSCAFTASAAANAQAYSSIDGTYTGSFADTDGLTISVNATLSQTPQSDTDGNFQLSGTGTFPNNPCFSSPVSVSSSQVTGGSFDLTYADPVTKNSVEALGTFSTNGKTLTVTQWKLTGSCGPDTGTGSLTKQ